MMGGGADDRTIAFLDLTRFTALNDTHGDATAVRVLDQFVDAVQHAVQGRGRVVKTLGDGVLLDVATPGAAVEVAAAISHRLHERDHMPELTGGVATGPVVERGDDVFGATVNLASRLADLATAGELRVTDATARAASTAGWSVEPLGPLEIRGVREPVLVHRVLLCNPDECVVDPVCGMRITPGAGTPTTAVNGTAVWFCSPTCLDHFTADPDRYRSHDGKDRADG